MALTLTTSGSLNTTVDNYAFSILSNTSSVQLGAVSLKLVVPGGCTIKNVNAGTSSVDSLVFLQQDGNLNIGMYTLSNWVVNTNDVILSITASGMSTGSFTLNTDEDWYCEIASSSAERFTDFAIKMPSLASPYASVSTTLEAVSILSGVNPSITSVGAPNSSVFGSGSRTLGTASIAEGINTLASGLASHAAGINTTASGQAAFSMGIETDADGMASFAAGSGSWARGTATVAMGIGTVASSSGQLVVGHYNEAKTDINNIFVVGDGTSNSLRRNVIEVYGGQGALFRGVKIDTAATPTITTAIDGFNVYGKTKFFGDVTGSSMLANNFNANGLDATIQLLGTSTGSFTSNFYRRQNVLGGGPGDFEDVLKASVRLDHKGINFSLSEQTTAPGSTFLWTNSSNRLFYSSSAVILNDGNTLGSTMTIGTTDVNNLQLETNNTTRIFISSSGRVGIGTSSPTERLHVDGNLLVTGRITAEEFHTEFVSASIIYQSGSTQFGNSLDDTHIFTGSLKVNGSITGSLFGTSSWAINALTASFVNTASTNAFVQNGNSFGATALLGTNDNQNLQLETSGSVRMTISSSGDVGIGTATPAYTLDVNGPFRTNNTAYVGEDFTFTSSQRRFLLEASADGLVTYTNNTAAVGQTTGFLSAELYLAGSQPYINHRAINTIVTCRNTSTSNILRGFYASGRTGNSGAANKVTGFTGGVNIEGSGNVTDAIALEIELFSQTNSKTITNLYGLKLGSLINSAGTITNTYGVYIDSLAAGTQTNAAFGLYQAGSDKNYFAGNVGIGTATPSSRLQVSGSGAGTDVFTVSPAGAPNVVIKADATLTDYSGLYIGSKHILRSKNSSPIFFNIQDTVIFTDNNAAKSTMNAVGSLGLGIDSSANILARLHARGTGATSATTALRVENSNASASLVVLDNGNVGIGTTTPSASLQVQGNFQISTGSLYTYGQNTDIDSGSIRTVMSVSTGSYRAAFFDYVLNKSTNARAGTVFSVWNGASVEWNDVSTNDIGNTAEINLSVGLSGANVILYASSSTNDWSVKALARML